MNNRIKELRKSLKLTQEKFANRIGSAQNTITGYESGKRVPSNPVISAICKEFRVNEDWLRFGDGDMFVPDSGNEIDALVEKYHLDAATKVFIEKFITLPKYYQDAVSRFLLETAAAIQSEGPQDLDEFADEKKIDAYCDALKKKGSGTGKSEVS